MIKTLIYFFLPSNLEKKKYRIKAFPLYNRCKGLFATNYTRKFFMGKIGEFKYPSGSDFEEEQKHLKSARKYGFSKGFSSLLAITGDAKAVVQ